MRRMIPDPWSFLNSLMTRPVAVKLGVGGLLLKLGIGLMTFAIAKRFLFQVAPKRFFEINPRLIGKTDQYKEDVCHFVRELKSRSDFLKLCSP